MTSRVTLVFQVRQCAYPGCDATFTVTRFKGKKRYCDSCAPKAKAKAIRRHKPTPKGYREYPRRVCQNALCAKPFTPSCGRQRYCAPQCRFAVSRDSYRLKEKRRRMKQAMGKVYHGVKWEGA